jgi:hypothetical protein
MFDTIMLIFIVAAFFGCFVAWAVLCMIENVESHTVEWRNERLLEWVRRPLPRLDERQRKKEIAAWFPSEEWIGVPYCLVDAIFKQEKTAEDIVYWVNYYFKYRV